MSQKPQRIKIPGRPEFVDLGACFDNEAAHGAGLVILGASELNAAPTGQLWKIGAPLVVGVIDTGKLK